MINNILWKTLCHVKETKEQKGIFLLDEAERETRDRSLRLYCWGCQKDKVSSSSKQIMLNRYSSS